MRVAGAGTQTSFAGKTGSLPENPRFSATLQHGETTVSPTPFPSSSYTQTNKNILLCFEGMPDARRRGGVGRFQQKTSRPSKHKRIFLLPYSVLDFLKRNPDKVYKGFQKSSFSII